MRRLLALGFALASVPALFAAGRVAAGTAQAPRSSQPPLLPPVPIEFLTRLEGPIRIRVGDAFVKTSLGHEIRVPLLEAHAMAPAGGGAEPVIHFSRVRVVGADVEAPPDTIVTGFDPFMELFGPRVVVDELVVENAAAREHAVPSQYPGRWLWRFPDIDARLRDVRLGGEGAREGLRIVRAAAAGEIRGRPVDLRSATVDAVRTRNRLDYDGRVRLGSSDLELTGAALRSGRWEVDVRTGTVRLADLRGILRPLPESGTGELLAGFEGGPAGTSAAVRRLRAAYEGSRIEAEGRVSSVGDGKVTGALVRLAPLEAEDVEALTGKSVPIEGELRGDLRAEGTFHRLAVHGDLVQRTPEGAVSDVTLAGDVRIEPEPVLDLRLAAQPLRAADTAFHVALRARGPLDALGLRGDVALVGGPDLLVRFDARLTDPAGAPPRLAGDALLLGEGTTFGDDDGDGARVWARADGAAVLADAGALDVRLRADSLPLDLLPVQALDSLRGFARGEAVLAGTLESPRLDGRFDLRGAGFRVRTAGLSVHDLAGPIVIRPDAVLLDSLTGRAGGGRLLVHGGAFVEGGQLLDLARGERPAVRLDLALEADSARLLDRDSSTATVSADLRLAGRLERPLLDGRVVVVEGRVFEDVITRQGPLDPDDPPYAELAARVPWIRDSRLVREPEDPGDGALPVRGGVDVVVTPGFWVIDEDSRLYGSGTIRVELADEGVELDGQIDVEGGFYAMFGERFRVAGGAVTLQGERRRIALLAEHEADAVRLSGEIWDLDRPWPPLEFFGHGAISGAREQVRRFALRPASQTELATLLLTGVEPQPVTEWRLDTFWLPDGPDEFFGERAEAQGLPLLWSYVADEAYDYLPLSDGYLTAGTFRVGGRWPGRIVPGPTIGGGLTLGTVDVLLTHASDGDARPGLRARWRMDGLALEAFHAPLFFAQPKTGSGRPGFAHVTNTGVTLRWKREF